MQELNVCTVVLFGTNFVQHSPRACPNSSEGVHPCSYNQAPADVRSTGGGIECLYSSSIGDIFCSTFP